MTTPARERANAARLLRRVVVDQRTTDQAVRGREVTPLTQELVLGSLRHFHDLSRLVDGALVKPPREKDQDIRLLMIVGVYQLNHLRIPDHAAINETVKACRDLGKPWATGLVNAVLRQIATRLGEATDQATTLASERSVSHPAWLEAALRAQYPDAETLMRANDERAPMALRVNARRIAPEAYRGRLRHTQLPFRDPRRGPHGGNGPTVGPGPETLLLEDPIPARDLPGFADGEVAVQDMGAQFAAPLLQRALADPGPAAARRRVLDACAAPGGKLFHLRERCPALDLTGLDNRPERLERVREEAVRLGHRDISLVDADATVLDWWDQVPFDAVLLDAPCSGTGTLRRHPDIKLLRTASDVEAMAVLQSRLLANLWQVVAPGGTLLYCTCSILAAENDDVVDAFLTAHGDASAVTPTLSSGRAARHGWQLLPTDPDTDGFYFSCLTRARTDKA